MPQPTNTTKRWVVGQDVLWRFFCVGEVNDEHVTSAWPREGQEWIVAVWTQHTQPWGRCDTCIRSKVLGQKIKMDNKEQNTSTVFFISKNTVNVDIYFCFNIFNNQQTLHKHETKEYVGIIHISFWLFCHDCNMDQLWFIIVVKGFISNADKG